MTPKTEEQLDSRGKPRVQTQFNDPSLTIQSDADQADIKKILGKYKTLGIVDHLNYTEATYADVTHLTDFADVMRVAKSAEADFMKLPSKVREIFDHDVANWLDSAHDPEKRASLAEAGLIEAEPQPNPPNTDPDVSGTPEPGIPDPRPEE